jgi:hypothetical protein
VRGTVVALVVLSVVLSAVASTQSMALPAFGIVALVPLLDAAVRQE